MGLPLVIEFEKKFSTIGYDIDLTRIKELKKQIDRTNEVETIDFKSSNIKFYK